MRLTDRAYPYDPEAWRDFVKVPAQYVVRVDLDGFQGAQNSGVTQLRPEPFVPHRITFATTGDTLTFTDFPATFGSTQGRACRVRFGDPFTLFFGTNPGLVSAVFGDSNGFLDMPRGLVLQGSQPIQVDLFRLFWPGSAFGIEEQTTRWDFTFHGIGLLPPGTHQSGSAG